MQAESWHTLTGAALVSVSTQQLLGWDVTFPQAVCWYTVTTAVMGNVPQHRFLWSEQAASLILVIHGSQWSCTSWSVEMFPCWEKHSSSGLQWIVEEWDLIVSLWHNGTFIWSRYGDEDCCGCILQRGALDISFDDLDSVLVLCQTKQQFITFANFPVCLYAYLWHYFWHQPYFFSRS